MKGVLILVCIFVEVAGSGDEALQHVLGCLNLSCFTCFKSGIVPSVTLTQPTGSPQVSVFSNAFKKTPVCVSSQVSPFGYHVVASAVYYCRIFSVLDS